MSGVDDKVTNERADGVLALEVLAAEIRKLKLLNVVRVTAANQALGAIDRAARREIEAVTRDDPAERARLLRAGLELMESADPIPYSIREEVLSRIEGRAPAPRIFEAPAPPPARRPAAEAETAPLVTLIAPPPAAPALHREPPETPETIEARRQRGSLLAGFAIGAIACVGGSIPLARLVWRSENDLLKFAAFGVVAMLFFAAGRFLEKRLDLALAGKTLQTIYLLLVPLLFAVADELGLRGAGVALALAAGAPVFAVARRPFAASFFLVAAANLAFPNALDGGGALLAGFAAAIAVAGGILELEPRAATVRPGEALLVLGGLGYAVSTVLIRSIARLDVPGADLAVPMLLTCIPAMLVAPRLVRREGADAEGARAAGMAIGAVTATVALAAYALSLASPIHALATASLGAAAFIVAAVRAPGPEVATAATASLALAYVAASALLDGGGRVGWPDLLDPHRAPGYLPLAIALLVAGGRARLTEALRPSSTPPLVAAVATAALVAVISTSTAFLGFALVALAATLLACVVILERAAPAGTRVPAAEPLLMLGLMVLGLVAWVHPPFLPSLETAGTGMLTIAYGALLLGGARVLREVRPHLANAARSVGLVAIAVGAIAAHAGFTPLAPLAMFLAAGGVAAVARGTKSEAATGAAALLLALALGEALLVAIPVADRPHPLDALQGGLFGAPLLALALGYALAGPRLDKAHERPLLHVALGLATAFAFACALEPAALAARHLGLAALVYFAVVFARPSTHLVAVGQSAASAGALLAVALLRGKSGLEALDPLTLAALGLAWIGVAGLLARAGTARLGGLAERATDFAAFSLACALGVVLWLAGPAMLALADGGGTFPPAHRPVWEALLALAGAGGAFALVTRRVPAAEAGCTAAAVVAAAWLVLPLVTADSRGAVPLAMALVAAVHLALRPAARASAPAGVAGMTAVLATVFALGDVTDGWRILTLLLAGPALYLIGSAPARRHLGVSLSGIGLGSLACGASAAWICARVDAGPTWKALAVAVTLLGLAKALYSIARRREPLDEPLAIGAAANALAAGLAVLAALPLGLERADFLPAAQTLAATATLLTLAFALFRAAIFLGSERVAYAGQLAVAATIVFLRIGRPDIFASGLFERFWPIILVGLAFVAFGLGTVLERRGLGVLARPLERVAIVIALAPIGGVWFVGRGAGSLALFLSAAFYGALAATRGRTRYAVVAVALANAGLHPLLLLGGFRYFEQPGVFFGPVGLSLVLASHAARGRLEDETRQMLRVAGSFLVLASLTFGVYADLAHRTLESLVLAVVCIAGAIAGLRLRIPAYVHLGTAFLLLDIASHVYWAGQDRPWVWWLSLVALGVAVIGYFAAIEGRTRSEGRGEGALYK